MNDITYAVSVDVNNPVIPYNVYIASVADTNVRYLEITLYENGNIIALSNTATATASLVTDNVLIDDSVECTISDNIITVPLEDLQRHGNLDVQVTVTEDTKVLAIPFPIQVRVTPNIAEEAQINENSMGSYAEVVQEIAEARGSYNKLKDHLDHKANAADVTAALALKEDAANKKTSTTFSSADDSHYPSVGAVKKYLDAYYCTASEVDDGLDTKADAAEVGENIARLNSGWHDFDIDYGELTAGYVKGTNGGIVESHSTLKRTGYIDLSSYNIKKLTFPQFYSGSLAGYAFFDSAQTFISGGVLGEATEGSVITVAIPASAKYVMISVKSANASSFYLKGSVNIFDNADPTLTKAGMAADAKATGDRLTRLNSGWHDFDIDYGELTVGYVRGTDGNVADSHNTLKRTDYIDLSSSNINKLTFPQFYSGTSAGYAFFNSAQTFISGGVLGEATEGSVITVAIPASAKYVMITVKNANAASFYLKGSMYIFDAIGESEENEDPLNIDPNKSLFSIFQHIGVIGDSLSSGYFNAPSNGSVPAATLTRYEYSWIQQLARRLGIEAFNFSKGGLSTRTWFTADDGAYPAMLTDGEHDCEAYFIALCHNDYNNRNEIPIGTESDAESLADTFYGNYSRIIKTIQDYSPCAKIFLITAKDVSTFEAYNAAMRYMTTIYTKNVYVLDMAVYGGGTDVPSWMKTGAHGNAMGYLLYSRWIESLTSWYIMNHPDEFKYVQFINTIREENIPASQNASLT